MELNSKQIKKLREKGIYFAFGKDGKALAIEFSDKWDSKKAEKWLADNDSDKWEVKVKAGKLIAKTYEIEIDDKGEHKVFTQPNGIKIKILTKPSDSYKAKLVARKDAEKARMEAAKEKEAYEKKVREKMREMAVKALAEEA